MKIRKSPTNDREIREYSKNHPNFAGKETNVDRGYLDIDCENGEVVIGLVQSSFCVEKF
jgi:hypothetical protein